MALIGVRNTSLLSHRPALCGKSSEGNAGFGFSHRSNAGAILRTLSKFLRTTLRRLLTISGLTAPVELCIGVVLHLTLPPIIYCLENAADPPKCQQRRAEVVRETARRLGLKICPLLLTEREECEYCHNSGLLFVLPDSLCWDCWQRQLANYGISIIERSTGKPVK